MLADAARTLRAENSGFTTIACLGIVPSTKEGFDLMLGFKTALACLACLAVVACVSGGTKVSARDMEDFRPGITTEREVIARFGEPNGTATQADGSKADSYIYTEAHAKALSFVPVVGLLAGGAVGHTTTATFTFGPDGLLRTTASSQGRANISTGVF